MTLGRRSAISPSTIRPPIPLYRSEGPIAEVLSKPVRHWSLTTLREKLIKIGAKVTRHSKSVFFQLAEVAITRNLFATILDRIAQLAIPPPVLVCGMLA
jgi:hypothetical protein